MIGDEIRITPDLLPADLRPFVWVNAAGCWIWRGRLNRNGYGRCGRAYGERVAHRVVYEALVGPIPDGMLLDHLAGKCTSRACCCPLHVEPVTPQVNTRRGLAVLFQPRELGWLHSRGRPRDLGDHTAALQCEDVPF